jgi:Lrp/AsnC family leucine-responsive transcriptional regulator
MLNEKELLILNCLRENSRCTITELSKKTGLSRSAVCDKIKKLNATGIIKRYGCLLNFERLSKPIHATVLFKCGAEKNELAQELENSPYTNNVNRLGNDFDFIASFVFDDMYSLHTHIEELAAKYKLESYKIFYISKGLKKEGLPVKSCAKTTSN